MELWIRSQDGERLTKATDLRIYYASKENVYAIEDCDDLGYYKTKERALQVLDEIQNIINYDGIKNEEYDETSGCYYEVKKNVYEMPKE